MRKLRLAIVGCGAVVEHYYVPALRELGRCDDLEVIAVFDPAASAAARIRASFPSAAFGSHLDEVIEARPDLAIVASPPRFHADQTIAMLRAGISVLCEKPMATTLTDGEAMVTAAAESGSVLAIGLFRRFFAVNQLIRDIVHSRGLGRVRRFRVSEGGLFEWPAQTPSFFRRSHSQGGVLADSGVHVLDVLIWWFGYPESFTYRDDAMGGLESNCELELEFQDGISGVVRLSRDTQIPKNTFIDCERGWLRCAAAAADRLELGFWGAEHSLDGLALRTGTAGAGGLRAAPALSYYQSFTSQLMNVVAAVRGSEKLVIPGEQGLASLRLIEQCYQQRNLIPMGWLTDIEAAEAASLSAAIARERK